MAHAPIVPAAAANNAAWCNLVCRAAGQPTTLRPGLWSTPRRSPDAHPDAVTLRPGIAAAAVLAAIDDSPGATVKDSFADLDLAPHGYDVLFEAEWLARPPVSPAIPELAWQVVDRDTMPVWLAVQGSQAITSGVLDDPDVRLLLATGDEGMPAAAALNRSGAGAGTFVGVSNVRASQRDDESTWFELAMLARRELGAHPLVGYESGPDLDAPIAVGFEPVGTLRVWAR